MDLAINFHDLISVANKVFGEGKWNHTVRQSLDFDNDINSTSTRRIHCTGCVSYVKIQLENGNFHEDIGYIDADEGLSIQTVRIGSAINGLFKILLSFGDKVERELKQLRRQIGSERVNTFTAPEPIDLAINFHDLISVANKVFGEGKWNHTVVRQTLDWFDYDAYRFDSDDKNSDDESFDDLSKDKINLRNENCAGCVSYVKIQLENGNFHEDIGYINADEFTKDLLMQNVRIGSAVNALKRVLLSFGDKVKKELQQLRRQISSDQVNTFDTAQSTDLESNFLDLISAANTVFGEGKWNHTVVSQTLDFQVLNYCFMDQGKRAGCVSSVKVQLENGNFHEDIGYFYPQELTKDFLIYSCRIGSAVNALRRVLLSFGDKVESELQQLKRQISSDQDNYVQRDVLRSLGKQISEKSSAYFLVSVFATTEPIDLAADFPDLISAANKVFGEGKWNHSVICQTLDFDYEDVFYDVDSDGKIHDKVNVRNIHYVAGCVSLVKVQLENGNFHQDVGYFYTKEPTRNLSIYNARIGSAVNALRRVLLSFGKKIDKELQRQVIPKQVSDIKRNATQSLEPMDLIAELPDLISAANKVFGEGNWRHTVIKQKIGKDYAAREVPYYVIDCVSYVKVQLKNENFHVDVGYCSTKEPTRSLAILNASIGSAVNGLKRVLMSFGKQFERELQRQIKLEQTNDVQDVTQSLDKQISEKLNVSGNQVCAHTALFAQIIC
ncbi:uncharacterized protein LOC143904859 [Temnothorax americanus]|uniref:uncharacterized protein LOC143904859 n=1 Tax=Temnothorax americanus TaxID=1964332 RepID=UPI004068BB99